MVLQHRGAQPIVIDSGRRVGGRLLAGVQTVLRATHPSLAVLYTQLAADGLLQQVMQQPDNASTTSNNNLARWGILGSSGGGFLAASQIPVLPVSSEENQKDGSSSSSLPTGATATGVDQGDFCHFIESRSVPTFTTNTEDLCANLLLRSGIPTHNSVTVDQATPATDGWHLTYSRKGEEMHDSDENQDDNILPTHFDGLVVATHNASFAADIVQGIAQAEQDAGTDAKAPVLQQLHRLATDLHNVRTTGKQPVFTWRGQIQTTTSKTTTTTIPFDTVTVPGSSIVQFLTRLKEEEDDMWTAVSTSSWAAQVLERQDMTDAERIQYVKDIMTTHVQQLLQPYHTDNDSSTETVAPVFDNVSVKRWGAAFSSRTLGATHAAVSLQPWRLTIAGDFIADTQAIVGTSTKTTPLEAAALSGLAAGEQTAAFFTQSRI
jgi:hypothetical protein